MGLPEEEEEEEAGEASQLQPNLSSSRKGGARLLPSLPTAGLAYSARGVRDMPRSCGSW